MVEKNEVGGKKFLERGPNKIVTPGLIWQPLQNFSMLRRGKKSYHRHCIFFIFYPHLYSRKPLSKSSSSMCWGVNLQFKEKLFFFFFVCFLLSTQEFPWPDKLFCTLYKMSLGRKITEIVANANDQKLKRSEKWWFPARNFAFVFWR